MTIRRVLWAYCAVALLVFSLYARTANASWWTDDNDPDNKPEEPLHTHPGHEDDTDPDATLEVACGSVIKLKHVNTGFRLHSHQVGYGSGSGQQSVTSVSQTDDGNSLWVVRGAHGKKRCKQGY
eukprot:TRINITY_DN2333_c0_g1_i2.p1 TRINITY_DN2333_c0_g1~~TRINITY_DN2333_c0_g1_i2.p1  ORF type:complete len:124 (+),score=16.53 TRINITY_DN2333_c0_g1_i2:35-406(+)